MNWRWTVWHTPKQYDQSRWRLQARITQGTSVMKIPIHGEFAQSQNDISSKLQYRDVRSHTPRVWWPVYAESHEYWSASQKSCFLLKPNGNYCVPEQMKNLFRRRTVWFSRGRLYWKEPGNHSWQAVTTSRLVVCFRGNFVLLSACGTYYWKSSNNFSS